MDKNIIVKQEPQYYIQISTNLNALKGYLISSVYSTLFDLISCTTFKDSNGVPYIQTPYSSDDDKNIGIAQRLRISKSSVVRAMNELENMGLVLRNRRGQGKCNNIYVFPLESVGIDSKPFIKVKKDLLQFSSLPLGAKILFSISENISKDFLKVDYAASLLNVCSATITAWFALLKASGMVQKIRRGQGLCDKLIVKPFKLAVSRTMARIKMSAMDAGVNVLSSVQLC